MEHHNPIYDLRELSEGVLSEVVREGELMMQAQLQSHFATEHRAFTFAGLTLTAATAALGGAIALSRSTPPDPEMARISAFFAIGMIMAGGLALVSAWPRRFCFPGNEPKGWLPKKWNPASGTIKNLKRARVEQAVVLQSMIGKNRRTATIKAYIQASSFGLAFLCGSLSGLALYRAL